MSTGRHAFDREAYEASQLFDLSGRRALVTGAGHGLGLATATALLGAGAAVVALDIDGAALGALQRTCRSSADHLMCVTADVAEDEAVDSAVAAASERLGGLDVVVNAAAMYPTAPLSSTESALLGSVLDTNVGGYLRVIRSSVKALSQSDTGRVLNFASTTFFLGIPDGLGAYIASKGAVIGMTRALARELGPLGVCVNAIAPGAFPTRVEEAVSDVEAYEKEVIANQCLRRRGRVEDIAAAVLFLASDAAAFITGQTLVVDGGWVFN